MNVIFKPQQERVMVEPEDIIIGGKKRGTIEVYKPEYPKSKFWAKIKIEGLSPGLLQGTGDTKESAIVEAMDKGIKEANLQLLQIQELKEQLAV